MKTDQQCFNLGMLVSVLSSPGRSEVVNVNTGNTGSGSNMSITLLDLKDDDCYTVEITDIKIEKRKL